MTKGILRFSFQHADGSRNLVEVEIGAEEILAKTDRQLCEELAQPAFAALRERIEQHNRVRTVDVLS